MRPYRYSVRRWQSSSTNSFVVKRQPYKRRVYHDLCTLRKRNPGQRGILPLLRHCSKAPTTESLTYTLDTTDGLKNGDTVTLTVRSYQDDFR